MEAHPYDVPFKVITELKAQIHELRAALLAEQQQRAAEVLELRNQLTEVKKELPPKFAGIKDMILTLQKEMATYVRSKDKSLEELKTQNRQALSQLNACIQDEIQARVSKEKLDKAQFETLSRETRHDTHHLQTSLDDLESRVHAQKEEADNKSNNLSHDLHQIVSYLQKMAGSWTVFGSEGHLKD